MAGNVSRVVIVTGASRGMGAEVVRWLAAAGCRIALIARSTEALADVAREADARGSNALPIACDVSDPAKCRMVVAKTMARFNRIDGLVNNAGIIDPITTVADADVAKWFHNIQVNLMGPFYLTRAALPALRASNGRVVNVSSGAAEKPIAGWSAYCAAKAALTHFTRVLAAEEPRVTSVSLRPGVVDTPMQEVIRRRGSGAMNSEKVAYFIRLKSDGKLEQPSIPARAIAWLALHAPAGWSGAFLEYDDPRIRVPARDRFADPSGG